MEIKINYSKIDLILADNCIKIKIFFKLECLQINIKMNNKIKNFLIIIMMKNLVKDFFYF